MSQELTKSEHLAIKSMIEDGLRLDVAIPADITFEQWTAKMSMCCRAVGKLDDMLRRLKPLIGRLINLASERPEIYKAAGCRIFSDFVNEYVPANFPISKTDAWAYRALVRDHPTLTMERFAAINPSRLKVLSGGGVVGPNSDSEEWYAKAQKMTVVELREEVARKGLSTVDEQTPATVTIYTTVDVARLWNDWRNSSKVRAVFGPSDSEILKNTIAEAWTSHPELSEGN